MKMTLLIIITMLFFFAQSTDGSQEKIVDTKPSDKEVLESILDMSSTRLDSLLFCEGVGVKNEQTKR